jgi:iron-sulfur cluster repair protein YtfE (RIC family)
MYGIATLVPGFEQPLAVLQATHQRIEAQLAALEMLPVHLAEHGADATARETARFALRFFDTTAADHQRDEEEDLFPLLRQRSEERAEISAVINEIEADHATLEALWNRLRRVLEGIVQGGAARIAASDVSAFAWLYRRHLAKESAIVLPFACEALTAAERAALGERMAARRRMKV